MTTQTFVEGTGSVLSGTTSYGDETILPLQTTTSVPNPSNMATATNPLLPDQVLLSRITNFPDEVYDLDETSHLIRFLQALLGPSGAGQLNKRYLVARLQQDMKSSHFFDLDAFYGAIFGALRNHDEQLPGDPLTAICTSDTWDSIHAADTSYRERLVKFATGIALGATYPGLKTLAEAVFNCQCEIYEVWQLLDDAHLSTSSGRTWDEVEAQYPTWDDFAGATWDEVGGVIPLGQSLTNNRSEIIVVPYRTWDTQTEQAADYYNARRVLNVLKPAGTLITISQDIISQEHLVDTSGYKADSEWWEMVITVKPNPVAQNIGGLYPHPDFSVSDSTDGFTEVPRPPFSAKQGSTSSLVPDITRVRTYTIDTSGDVNSPDEETYAYGTTRVTYSGDQAVISPRNALAAQIVSDGNAVAAPYSQPRIQVKGHS